MARTQASSAAARASAGRSEGARDGRPRLSVFRSSKHIYAQVIDDAQGRTLAAASPREGAQGQDQDGRRQGGRRRGRQAGRRARARRGVNEVVFDRGGYLFHGRVKALAEPRAKAA